MASMTVVSLLLACTISSGLANEFLKEPPKKVLNEHVSEEEIRTSILEEIEGTFGAGSISKRATDLEAALKPMYTVLPKNEHGMLGHSTVRYALHRLFILRHGWDIRGLGGRRGADNTSTATGVLKDQVPAYIQDLFEKRLGGRGLDLHDLAVFASAIEHLIHTEAVKSLGAAFDLHKLVPTNMLTEDAANEVMDTYMMGFILGEDLTNMTLEDAQAFTEEMPETFGHWSATQKFVRDIRTNVTGAPRIVGNDHAYLDFPVLSKVAEQVGATFGNFQDVECQGLKKSLVSMETSGSGRVKLSDFYAPALDNPGPDGSWQFTESVAYLRQLGALDESNPQEASVIIPNYLHSSNNCIASSGFYSICCKDECEGLLGQLETQIAAPEGSPQAVGQIVKNLASSTVSAPRELPATLLKNLDSIAEKHDGMIPLHGRLFAQFLHHAFPRECPYPHLSGTVNQQLPEEFGSGGVSSEEEMLQHTTAARNAKIASMSEKKSANSAVHTEPLVWTSDEELLVERSLWPPMEPDPKVESTPPLVRSLVLFAVAGTFSLGLMKTFKTSLVVDSGTNAKQLV
jgi:hypothetical protein